jgi:hypothetical protein
MIVADKPTTHHFKEIFLNWFSKQTNKKPKKQGKKMLGSIYSNDSILSTPI